MKKFTYHIKNLDCANCAQTIESELSKISFLKNVAVNFSKLTLRFETDYTGDILSFIQREVKKIESSVIISDTKLENDSLKKDYFRILIGTIFFLLSYLLPNSFQTIFVVIGFAFLLKNTFLQAILLLKKGILNENFLITISAIGAFGIGKSSEGFMVIFLYEIGKCLEKKATGNVRRNVSMLMEMEPVFAHLLKDDQIEDVTPDSVPIGSKIVVLKGEKIPLDGILLDGMSELDTSSLTGESIYRNVAVGDSLLSGSINMGNKIVLEVTSDYQNSTVKQILDLVEHATDRKTKTENFVSKAAKIYTPVMLLISIIIFFLTPFLFSITYSESFYRALTILVVSCPCAIAISVPLCYFAGIGAMSKKGILVKGSNYIDALKKAKNFVFDKTGTLTTGKFGIQSIQLLNKEITEQEFIKILVMAETYSTHPLAKSILAAYPNINVPKLHQYEEILGKGITYEYQNAKCKVGSSSFVGYEKKNEQTTIYISKNDEVIGYVVLGDEIKKEAKSSIQSLKKSGIRTYLFTGDQKESALKVANELGIDEVNYELLPTDKFSRFEELKKQNPNELVAFVGDGINDAPVLRLSDCGISMGSGSLSAIEASDIVIMSSDIGKILEAKRVSNKTIAILKLNLIFALGIKLFVLIFSFFGIVPMWLAVFADVGVTLLTILNALRILK